VITKPDGGDRLDQPPEEDNETVSVELRDVLMPELQGAEEITVGAWNKKQGDHVDEGETLMEAHTDKVNAEIPSPVSGTVEQLLLHVGDPVKPGQPIARVAPE
jgi:pyruvate/2-oxoglutarate dehydrogenase complex dihydrolipoamide acyltransferase (E2) component